MVKRSYYFIAVAVHVVVMLLVILLITFDITILYYNPNIYPYDEYLKGKKNKLNY